MTQPHLLHQFEYTVPPSSLSISGPAQRSFKAMADHANLLRVIVDFEAGEVIIEGDRKFILQTSAGNRDNVLSSSTERIIIQANLSSFKPLDLDDVNSVAFIFPLDGCIEDGDTVRTCTGMVAVDHVLNDLNNEIQNSFISIYIYDMESDDNEIMFRFPAYPGNINCNSN